MSRSLKWRGIVIVSYVTLAVIAAIVFPFTGLEAAMWVLYPGLIFGLGGVFDGQLFLPSLIAILVNAVLLYLLLAILSIVLEGAAWCFRWLRRTS